MKMHWGKVVCLILAVVAIWGFGIYHAIRMDMEVRKYSVEHVSHELCTYDRMCVKERVTNKCAGSALSEQQLKSVTYVVRLSVTSAPTGTLRSTRPALPTPISIRSQNDANYP